MSQVQVNLLISLPDDVEISNREMLRAMEKGLQNRVIQNYRETLPVEQNPQSVKYRHLPEDQRLAIAMCIRKIQRATFIEEI